MIGIVGSGFGLYGYLPAVALASGEQILLMEHYRNKFNSRPELQIFENRIEWAKDLQEITARAHTMILSVTPAQQSTIVRENIIGSRVANLILEKPVDVSPKSAAALLEKILLSGINFRVGYNLVYTGWARKLISLLGVDSHVENIEIDWSFMAHHYRTGTDTWKRNVTEGGGILRFYGIHFIALAALLGYNRILGSDITGFSDTDLYACHIVLQNGKGSRLSLHLDSHAAQNIFALSVFSGSTPDPVYTITQKDPFTDSLPGAAGILDHRIDSLQAIFASLFNASLNTECREMYLQTNDLWKAVEKTASVTIKK